MAMFNIFGKANVTTENKTAEELIKDKMYDLTEANTQMIGNLEVASIDLDLGEIDDSYQRYESLQESNVNYIASHFDNSKVGLPKVSRHADEKRYYIIDGIHRWKATKKIGPTNLTCEIVTLSDDPVERRKQEAKLFAEQNKTVEKVTPFQKHKANVLLGIKENVDLDDVVNNTEGIQFKEPHSTGKVGDLAGFTAALEICKWYGKEHFQSVVDTIIGARWNTKRSGFGNDALRMVSTVLLYHKGKEIEAEIARLLHDIPKVTLEADAKSTYHDHTKTQANVLYLEDLLCYNLNIPRLIDYGREQNRIA